MSAGSSASVLNVSRELDKLAPMFADSVRAAIKECNEMQGLQAMVYEAYRSQELQAEYYKRGRTVIPPIRTVTNAPTNLHSWHGYGLAVDVVHQQNLWSPPEGDAWFGKVAAVFKRYGCNWGGDWTQADLPHFQWGKCSASPSEQARALLQTQGFGAVWEKVGALNEAVAGTVDAANALSPANADAIGQQRMIGIIENEGFTCQIFEDADGRVVFTADANIDADGANGQNGGPAAYMSHDSGTEALANGGMRIEGSKVVCAQSWARDIVILDTDNEPKVFPGGVIASMTWYREMAKAKSDPTAYVDAETVPYIVVPSLIVQKTAGVVCGCKARVTYHGVSVDCVVADRGPSSKIGELSIAAARVIGMNPSPRNGGTEKPEVLYELWPGVAAVGFVLQPA